MIKIIISVTTDEQGMFVTTARSRDDKIIGYSCQSTDRGVAISLAMQQVHQQIDDPDVDFMIINQ